MSKFWKLESQHDELKAALPTQTSLTAKNTKKHAYIRSKRSCAYVSVHAIYCLCTIALYREYMAFAPWAVSCPVGPLDEPRLKGSPPNAEYWIRQAQKCFGAAKDYVELLKACQKGSNLTESPIVGFATFLAAWCGKFVVRGTFPKNY